MTRSSHDRFVRASDDLLDAADAALQLFGEIAMTDATGRQLTYKQVSDEMDRAHQARLALRGAMAWWNMLGWMGGQYR